MKNIYRVVCSENQRLYPGKTFIDIYPAGSMRPENSLTHDCLLQMRRMASPGVDKIESGILLTELDNGEISLQYEKRTNYRLRRYQEHLRQRLDPKIIATFKEMKSQNKDRTLEVSLVHMAIMFDLFNTEKDKPLSAREDALIRENMRQKRQAAKRRELIARQAAGKYAAHPEIMLAWKQALYRGD